MKKIHIRTTALLAIVGALCAVGIVAATSFGASEDDNWTPANTPFKAVSTNSSFTAGLTDECKPFEIKGITPPGDQKKGSFNEQEAQKQTKVTPSVAGCNNPTVVGENGPWHVRLHSEGKGFEGQCKEPKLEEDDCFTVEIPNEGAKIKFGLCEVKVKANTLTTNYNDETGEAKFENLIVQVEGCGVTEAKFKGTFTIRAIKQNGEEVIIKDGE